MNKKMTDDQFMDILKKVLTDMTGDKLLAIPGMYEAVSEELNNEVIEIWEDALPKKEA